MMAKPTLAEQAEALREKLNVFLKERLKDSPEYPQPTIGALDITSSSDFTTAAIELSPDHTEEQAAVVRHIIQRYIANNGPQVTLDFDPNGPPQTGHDYTGRAVG